MGKRAKGVLMMGIMATILSFSGIGCADPKGQDKDIHLPAPNISFKVDLGDALKARHSSRSFTEKQISREDLSTILWAANGINRENKGRTAPAPFGKDLIDIYVTMREGVYLYQPAANRLKWITNKPINDQVGKQGDIRKASHVLILVGKIGTLPFIVKKEDRITMAHATAGCIGQNVYLAAEALHLGTRMVQSMNANLVKTAIHLKDDHIPLYIMPLGYPKE
jgi:SagB-type dehydrogenase family enzyme